MHPDSETHRCIGPLHVCNLLRTIAISLQPLKDTPYETGWLLGCIYSLAPFILRSIVLSQNRGANGAVMEDATRYLRAHGAVDHNTTVRPCSVVDIHTIESLLAILLHTDMFRDLRADAETAADRFRSLFFSNWFGTLW